MRYPPTSVSIACRIILLGAFLAAITGVMALVLMRSLAAVGAAAPALAMATLLYLTFQRLSLGDRTWWYVALALLGVSVLLALAAPGDGGGRWSAVVPGFALACLLTPSAWRFYTTPAEPAAAAPSEP
jgi:hypothetical protein